ncbi:MAG: hypothetical protein IJW00_08670 [Clostridia bacterium]|nr:hypothetical protein [Clostridia bacterium]
MFFPKSNRPERPIPEKKPITPEAKKRAIVVLIMSIVLLVLYYGIMTVFPGELITMAVMGAYMLVFAVLLVSYIAYNRGFVNKDVTEEMLPESWSEEKKKEFVAANKRRAEKSRWMMVLIIPFVVVFMAEALYLFVWDGWLSNFFLN